MNLHVRALRGAAPRHAMKRFAVCLVSATTLVAAIGPSCLAVCAVSIDALSKTPAPPNPIKILGRVTSASPVRLSDGKGTITVSGLTASVGDFLVVTGNWDGSVLTGSGPTEAFVGPSRTHVIYVPAGSFLMGNSSEPFTDTNLDNTYDLGEPFSDTNGNGHWDGEPYSYPEERPQHSVYLSGYWIGKYEVTRGQYAQFMAAGGYSNRAYWSSEGWDWLVMAGNRTQPDYWDAIQDWRSEAGYSPPQPFTQTENHPVVGVTYFEAEAFCNWAGGHLPTEAQWEKAGRWTGSHTNIYPWGDTWDDEKCNNYYDHNPAGGGYERYQTSPVGSYPGGASPYGLHDMTGNAWEWCRDGYSSDYYSQTPTGGWIDPQGPTGSEFRVLRGGGWAYDDTYYLYRCAARWADFAGEPGYGYFGNGFRMAR